MYSSKITINGDKSSKRLNSKDEYIETLIDEMRANTEFGENLFKTMLSVDEELRYDIGGLDKDNLKWYKNRIIKQLYKLDIITLTFLLNSIEQARGDWN